MQPPVNGMTASSIRLLSCLTFYLKAQLVTCFAKKNNTKSYLFRNTRTFHPVVSHNVLVTITVTSSLYASDVLEALTAV